MRVEGEARSQPHTQISVRPLALWHSRSLGECNGRACGPQRSELRWCPRGRPSLARRRTAPAERSRRWLDFHAVAAIRARGSLCGANADGPAQRHTHNAPTWPISVIATTRTFGSRPWLALGRAGRQSRGPRHRSIGSGLACERSGYSPTCASIDNAFATPHLADQRAREASARHEGRDTTLSFE